MLGDSPLRRLLHSAPMFRFLQRLQAPAILADCEKESNRTARAGCQFVSVPRDMSARAALLQRAVAAGLADHETVKRLDFLQRLLVAVTGNPEPSAAIQDALVAEAKRYQLEHTSGVQVLRKHRELEQLKQEGPRVMAHDQQGRDVYFQCAAEFKNKPGRFDLRDDGATFTGEVVVEIAWSNVVHAAKTTHTYQGVDYSAVAFQEGKRRTPTKFVFTRDQEADYACEVTMRLWEQSKKQGPSN